MTEPSSDIPRSVLAQTIPDFEELIHTTLKQYVSESERCLYCDRLIEEIQAHHASCCSDHCWTAVYAIGTLLNLALDSGSELDKCTALLRFRGKDAELALNIMGVIIIYYSDLQLREKTRKIFQKLQESSSSQIPPRCLHLNTEEFEHVQGLAVGGHGSVAVYRYSERLVAVKTLFNPPGSGNDVKRELVYETLIWKRVKHERLMPLLGVFDQSPNFGMVSPLCEHLDVIIFLKTLVKNHERYRWKFFYRVMVYRWLLQIAEGLNHLHDEGIVHGDLHPGNILVVNAHPSVPTNLEFDILITDFGLSIYYGDNSGENGSRRGGRTRFCAPELQTVKLKGSKRPTQESDCFAWAATAYNIFTTKEPYIDEYRDPEDVKRAILRYQLPSKKVDIELEGRPYEVSVPDQLLEVIADCWQHPDRRIKVEEIMARLKPMQGVIPIAQKT